MGHVITTVVVITAISSILTLLITVANKTVNDYGDVKITINNEKTLDVRGGSTLLSLLVDNEIFIPSACGGKGSCGFCKVKVLEGAGPILPTEESFITKDEEKDHVRLSCQVKVKNDLKIEIDEELFNVKQYDYTVLSNENVTDTIKNLIMQLPEGKEINFKPGQYIQLMSKKYKGSSEEVYRAYSIASSPNDKNQVGLLIGHVPEGIVSSYVHYHLHADQKVTVVGPYGDFYYRENDKEMVMVAIGTGMAPILSILRYMREEKLTHRKATFFYGAKVEDELFFGEEFEELQRELPNFKYVPCLSRVPEGGSWAGERGRVTDAIQKYIDNGPDCEAYLCGSGVMIDSVVDLLKQKGLAEEDILYDKF
ncbi:MAG: FAD-binding oxidoreductase [Peptostreptococcaceae bacterium]|nr:FAD-binding oxidoreductase [Peptostreptococcaceae bacterium]